MIDVSAGLLAEAKNYLDITWQDADGDAKLTGQIRRGIAFISAKTGVPQTAYESDSESYDERAQELLFNYLLYDRAGSADQFRSNYAPALNGIRMREEVKRHAASAEG